MKGYEKSSSNYLVKKVPVIIRLDGRAFKALTKDLHKPYDEVILSCMQDTMKYLCENIQGCVFGYTQSDEITLVLTDYENLDSCAWFDYNAQKLASVSASMATYAFIMAFIKSICYFEDGSITYEDMSFTDSGCSRKDNDTTYSEMLKDTLKKGISFDSRAFNVPKEDVINNIIWRQQDCINNSIISIGRTHYSHDELVGKTQKCILHMLEDKYVYWEDYSNAIKYGVCCYKNGKKTEDGYLRRVFEDGSFVYKNNWVGKEKPKWIVDFINVPDFSENKGYLYHILGDYVT